MIMRGCRDGPYGASVPGQDALPQQLMAGVISSVEGHHDVGADVVQLVGQSRQLTRIERQWLFHERRQPGPRELQGECRMGARGGRDDDAVERG
jgi:hypothetical protein